MAFRILLNSTTADASDVNDNFFWGAQGSIIPMGNSSLEYTDSAYDIGSQVYRWNVLYCGTIASGSIHSGGLTYEYLERKDISAPTTTIAITGLNGDNDNEYLIVFSFIKTTATTHDYVMFLNNTSGGMIVRGWVYGAIGLSDTFTSSDGLICRNTATGTFGSLSFGWVKLKADSDENKIMQIYSHGGIGGLLTLSSEDTFCQFSGVDLTSTDTVTSLYFHCYTASTTTDNNFQSGSFIEIWRKPH